MPYPIWKFVAGLEIKCFAGTIGCLVIAVPLGFMLIALGVSDSAVGIFGLVTFAFCFACFVAIVASGVVAKCVGVSCPVCGKKLKPLVVQDNWEQEGVVELRCVCGFYEQLSLLARSSD